MDLISTEGPILLGYLALAAVVAAGGFVMLLLEPATRDRRRRNRLARVRRHAAAGCDVCRLRLLVEDGRREVARLEAQAAQLDADAFLDFPTGGPR